MLQYGVSWDIDLWCNEKWWNSESRDYATKTWPWDVSCNLRRNHKLSNWNKIRDFSWNVWEHVNKANTIDWKSYGDWQTSINWSSDWNNGDDDWIYDVLDMDKYASTYYYWYNKWMWNIWHANWVATNIFIRGWSSEDGSTTWIFALSLDWPYDEKDWYVGFRCVK